jgi:hypothetical protein
MLSSHIKVLFPFPGIQVILLFMSGSEAFNNFQIGDPGCEEGVASRHQSLSPSKYL